VIFTIGPHVSGAAAPQAATIIQQMAQTAVDLEVVD
jgi:hypothetical protein